MVFIVPSPPLASLNTGFILPGFELSVIGSKACVLLYLTSLAQNYVFKIRPCCRVTFVAEYCSVVGMDHGLSHHSARGLQTPAGGPTPTPRPSFVNKVLLEHSHVHSLTYRPWLLLLSGRAEQSFGLRGPNVYPLAFCRVCRLLPGQVGDFQCGVITVTLCTCRHLSPGR